MHSALIRAAYSRLIDGCACAIFVLAIAAFAGAPAGAASYSGTVTKGVTSPDWIQITFASDTALSISMTGSGGINSGNAGFYLYDATKTSSLMQGYAGGSVVGANAVRAGNYWLRVWCNDGFASGAYSITTTETAAPLANDAEPNDTQAQAASAVLGSPNYGHIGYGGYTNGSYAQDGQDWWRIVLPSAGPLSVSFSISGASGGFFGASGYYIYNSNNGVVASSTNLNAPPSPVSLAAGTYFVQLWVNSAWEYASYAMTPTFSVPASYSASATGTIRSLTLSASVQPSGADLGKQGKVYVAAVLGGQFFFFNGSTWSAWSGGTIPSYYSGALTSMSVPLLSGFDASVLAGTQIYTGYGLSESDMIANGKFGLAYTIR